LAKNLEFIGEVAANADVLALLHLLDGSELSRGLGAHLVDVRVGAFAEEFEQLIVQKGVSHGVVLDHFPEDEGRLLLQ
jgi:hypothetical protein